MNRLYRSAFLTARQIITCAPFRWLTTVAIRSLIVALSYLVAAVLFALLWASTTSPLWNTLALAVLATYSAWQVVQLRHWLQRERWAGALIFDASAGPKIDPDRRLVAIVFAALSLVAAVCTVAFWPQAESATERRVYVTVTAVLASLAILALPRAFTKGKVEFRQRGVLQTTFLIPWNEIESWFFDALGDFEGDDGSIVLRINRRRAAQLAPVRIHIAPSQCEQITREMNRRATLAQRG